MKGYQLVLGSMYLQLPLFIVTLVYVTVPIDLEYYVDARVDYLVNAQLIVHALITLNYIGLVFPATWRHMELVTSNLAIILSVLQFFLLMEHLRALAQMAVSNRG